MHGDLRSHDASEPHLIRDAQVQGGESLAHIAPAFRGDVARLPVRLRRLLDDELAAGNSILSVGHSHPAPPIGAFIMLAEPVTTRARKSDGELLFIERNSSLYRGEFSDEERNFFILEAPGPPPEEPDMDAIRNGAHRASAGASPTSVNEEPDSPRARFDRSRVIDYEKWHDGIGYDLDALGAMTDAQRANVAKSLVPPSEWRDVEALAAIDSDEAREALRRAGERGSNEVRMAVIQYAPHVLQGDARTDALVRALKWGQLMEGIGAALEQAESFHPPRVLATLWRGLAERPGDIAYNFAATLAVIYGKIESSADWTYRPLFLRFNSDDGAERRAAREELAALLGVSSETADPPPE